MLVTIHQLILCRLGLLKKGQADQWIVLDHVEIIHATWGIGTGSYSGKW